MIIAERIRSLREFKNLSQGDIEDRTGLIRCYISRVENGHTVPTLHTIEKIARALEVPLHMLFYDGEEPPKLPRPRRPSSAEEQIWGSAGKEARLLSRFRHLLGKMDGHDRKLLFFMAQELARR